MLQDYLPEQVQNVIKEYFALPLGGKKVKCPYFMNLRKERAGLRVMVGKGSAEEITHEVKVWAQLKGIDLNAISEQQIREFMIQKGIGIDCSGFAVYALDAWTRFLGKGHIWKRLKYFSNSPMMRLRRWLRPVENIGANLLTSDLNCEKITDLNLIQPGDMIRAKGKQENAHHVAIISEVFRDENTKKLKRFVYVHAHRFYGPENGVRKGEVEIIDLTKSLKDQKWTDHYQNRNYMLEDLLVDYEDNGIRRLKFLAK
jgi:hypothetical protein